MDCHLLSSSLPHLPGLGHLQDAASVLGTDPPVLVYVQYQVLRLTLHVHPECTQGIQHAQETSR